jgi:hypothetical protein
VEAFLSGRWAPQGAAVEAAVTGKPTKAFIGVAQVRGCGTAERSLWDADCRNRGKEGG